MIRAIDRLMADGPVPVCFLGGLGRVFAGRLAGRYAGPDPRAARHRARRRADAGAEPGMSALFSPRAFDDDGAGPLYLQLTRRIAEAIETRRARSRARACRRSARWRA